MRNPIVVVQDPLAHVRMLSVNQVCEVTGYSRTHLYRLEAAGLFPRRVRLSHWRVAFRLSDIEAWLKSRPFANGSGGAPVPTTPPPSC